MTGLYQFLEDPTYEDIRQVGQICQWDIKRDIKKSPRKGDINTTKIILNKQKDDMNLNRLKQLNVIEFEKFKKSFTRQTRVRVL